MIRTLALFMGLVVIFNPVSARAAVINTALPGNGATSTTTLSGPAASNGSFSSDTGALSIAASIPQFNQLGQVLLGVSIIWRFDVSTTGSLTSTASSPNFPSAGGTTKASATVRVLGVDLNDDADPANGANTCTTISGTELCSSVVSTESGSITLVQLSILDPSIGLDDFLGFGSLPVLGLGSAEFAGGCAGNLSCDTLSFTHVTTLTILGDLAAGLHVEYAHCTPGDDIGPTVCPDAVPGVNSPEPRVSVPGPAPLLLLAVGTLALAAGQWRRRRV